MTLGLPFLLALLVSATLVPILRAIAFRVGFALPRGFRSPASRPKALSGGVTVALALLAGSMAVGAFSAVSVLLLGSAALLAVGATSDAITLRPSTKLVAQIAVAALFLFFDYRLHWADSVTLDSIITIFWIVGITSAFHLLDNMDGLCAGVALIAGTAFLLTVLPVPQEGALLVRTQYLMVLLGATAGFLVYNIHPSSVTLGESGSLVIGLNMAAMTLQIAPGRGSNLLAVVAVPVLVLLIPILDATVVAVSRLVSRPFADSASHPSQRLVAIGLSEGTAVGVLWALAAVSGLIAVLADRGQQGLTGLMVAMFTVALALFAVYLSRVQVHQNVDPDKLPGVTPLGIELGYQRRLGEVLLDLLLVSVAYYGAYRLRFEGAEYVSNFPYFMQSFPVVLGTQMLALFVTGAYRGMWRYFSLSDGVTFARSVALGAMSSVTVLLLLYRFEGYSPALFVIYGMLLLILLVGSRASFRMISEFVQQQRHAGRRLVIYGAGDRGSMAVRHFLNEPRSSYRLMGLVDDDARKRNVRVHGYSVIGGYDHLVGLIMAGDVDVVAIAQESPSTQGLAALCARYGVALQRIDFDWREVPAAIGGGAVEGRVVPFSDPGRERSRYSRAGLAIGHEGVDAERPLDAVSRDVSAAPIRVVHIITRLILGGAQENTLATAIGQHADPRFDVTLLCGVDEAGEGNMFAQATSAGVHTIVMPSLLREIRPLTDLKAVFDLYRFLKRGSYAVVHTHSSKAGIIGRMAARAAGVPVIVHTQHGLAFHEFQSAWKNQLYILLERLCAPMTDTILSVSARLGEAAIAEGIGRRDQHATVFSGIDLDAFLGVRDRLGVEEAKRQAGIPPDAPVVGKIARLFELKGHDQFLAAAAEIHRELPETYFLLVGDGPLRDYLTAEAERLGLAERVVMVGRVAPERVPEYIQAMDVVVHTSLREGIARVLPQAGAVGKPVVTFALDGAPEVVRDGVSGYLVPAVDTKHVAERTVELLRDPERRRAFGEAGRAFAAEHFSVERMVERINLVYLDLLARGGRKVERASAAAPHA